MNKINVERVAALSDYPFHVEITTRVSDLDGYGHLNAIRTGHFYEDARASFYGPAFDGLPRMRSLVAQLSIRYLREGFWPGVAQVGTGIARVGNSSFEMAQGLFQNDVCIGTCSTILVYTEKGRSAPLPAPARERLQSFLVTPR